jgi:hypothetical protein
MDMVCSLNGEKDEGMVFFDEENIYDFLTHRNR